MNNGKEIWHQVEVPKIDPDALKPNSERPRLGQALLAAVEAMLTEHKATIEGGRIIWGPQAEEELETIMGPRLANALAQPLQHSWVLEYFLAVMMVHAERDDSIKAVHTVLATYIGMSCGCVAWPAAPTPEEEAEAKRMADELHESNGAEPQRGDLTNEP